MHTLPGPPATVIGEPAAFVNNGFCFLVPLASPALQDDKEIARIAVSVNAEDVEVECFKVPPALIGLVYQNSSIRR